MRTFNLLFVLMCLIFGLNVKAQEDYQRVTDLSQIQNGSTIIFAARHDSLQETSYYAMTNAASGKPQGVMFTAVHNGDGMIVPTEILENETDYSWVVGVADGGYTFINADGDMIAYGSSGTDFVKNGVNSTWSIDVGVSGEGTMVSGHNAFVITNVGVTNRSVAFRKYNSDELYEKFAPYSNSNTNMSGDIYYFYIDIFVKSSETTPIVSLPHFSPPGGDYTETQNVSISCSTEDATIYYTTDGTDPTTESEVYSQPLEISAETTLKAMAVKEGMLNSGIAVASYNFVETVSVSFYSNGLLFETVNVTKGEAIGELPEATAPDGFSFSGWTDAEIQSSTNVAPDIITSSTVIQEDAVYYAVFSISNSNCVEMEISSFSKSDEMIIAVSKDDEYFAMSQEVGDNGQPVVYPITVANGKIISHIPDEVKWNVDNNNGSMIIYPAADEERWLYCTSGSNNNSVRIGDNTDNNIFEIRTEIIDEQEYPNYLYNTNTLRYVGVYYSDGEALDWRAYKLTASGAFPTNIRNQTYHFFKCEGYSNYCTNIDIPETQTIASNTDWNNVSLQNPIIVQNGATLTINGLIACADAENLIIKDGAQLIHNNANVVATVEKEIQGYGNTNSGWYTISSPLAANVNVHDVDGLIPATNAYDLYRYDEPASMWENVKDPSNNFTTLDVGRAYLYANENDATISFVGELCSEDVSYDLLKTDDITLSGFNLIANPFAHNIYKGSGAAIDDDNLATGYYVLSNSGAWGAKVSEDTPILPCQGILVKTMQAGPLTIKKTNAAPSAKNDDNVYLEIAVANGDYADVSYISFSDKVGLEKINHHNDDIPMIYVPVDGTNYAIVALDEQTEEVSVSFMAKVMGEYTISASSKYKQFDYVYLVDKQTGEETNLITNDYTFMATTNDNPDRFIVKFYDVNSIDEINRQDNFVYISNNELIINDMSGTAEVDIYDVMGRKVLHKEFSSDINTASSITLMNTDEVSTGIYVVRMLDADGVRIQKIVIGRK